MKKISIALSLLLIVALFSCNENKANNEDLEETNVNKKVKGLISKMTIEEKIGQMTQINISVILKDGYQNKDGSLNKDSLSNAIQKYKVGSILNATPGQLCLL